MGRVVQRGDSLNVQAELMDVDSGAQLWGERYNRKLADLLTVQEEIAKEISERLRLAFDRRGAEAAHQAIHGKRGGLPGLFTRTLPAYRYTAEGMRRGIEFLNRAIELEPKSAQASAGLAEAYVMSPAISSRVARRCPKRARQLKRRWRLMTRLPKLIMPWA